MVMCFFAALYVALDGPHSACGIAPKGRWPTYYNAFAFSMETMTTIGYGIPNDPHDFFEEECAHVRALS